MNLVNLFLDTSYKAPWEPVYYSIKNVYVGLYVMPVGVFIKLKWIMLIDIMAR